MKNQFSPFPFAQWVLDGWAKASRENGWDVRAAKFRAKYFANAKRLQAEATAKKEATKK